MTENFTIHVKHKTELVELEDGQKVPKPDVMVVPAGTGKEATAIVLDAFGPGWVVDGDPKLATTATPDPDDLSL